MSPPLSAHAHCTRYTHCRPKVPPLLRKQGNLGSLGWATLSCWFAVQLFMYATLVQDEQRVPVQFRCKGVGVAPKEFPLR